VTRNQNDSRRLRSRSQLSGHLEAVLAAELNVDKHHVWLKLPGET
jgi:hypothetical protein